MIDLEEDALNAMASDDVGQPPDRASEIGRLHRLECVVRDMSGRIAAMEEVVKHAASIVETLGALEQVAKLTTPAVRALIALSGATLHQLGDDLDRLFVQENALSKFSDHSDDAEAVSIVKSLSKDPEDTVPIVLN